MNKEIKVAILGSTGFVGLEILKILLNHPHVSINFLGCDKLTEENKNKFISCNYSDILPNLSLNKNFDYRNSDVVFLALPHGVSHLYVKKFFDKIKIIDLSADFRLDSLNVYKQNYNETHSCPNLLNNFVYGLPEINRKIILKNSNIAIPGCYPTSILLPLIPIIRKNLINTDNIIIDSKSGYSGAGKNFNINNIKKLNNLNFYNYNTNNHRHICEIKQELDKRSTSKINFSFNPHILPNFRGMMSTIYCDLENNISINDIFNTLDEFYIKSTFVKLIKDEHSNFDFFSIQENNNCLIKLFHHHSINKVIIVSLIDNLMKGAAGQAVQNFNIMFDFKESLSLVKI